MYEITGYYDGDSYSPISEIKIVYQSFVKAYKNAKAMVNDGLSFVTISSNHSNHSIL